MGSGEDFDFGFPDTSEISSSFQDLDNEQFAAAFAQIRRAKAIAFL